MKKYVMPLQIVIAFLTIFLFSNSSSFAGVPILSGTNPTLTPMTMNNTSLDSNTVKITSLFFDTTKNQIRVKWTVNMAAVDTAEIGVSYSLAASPVLDSSISQVILAGSPFDSAVVRLKEPLVFDTKYYVALWERRTGGSWTAPASYSKDSLRTPGFHWQDVVYFSKENDTVYAFNKKLRFTNIPGDLSKTQNTVLIFSPASASLKGFIPVSVGFEFRVKDAGIPFNIALKIDSVLAGHSLGDIRIYRWSTSGQWLLDILPLSIDSVHGYVSELTNQLDYPFIAMVDTMPIANALIISGVYIPNDTAIVNLDNIQTIDTSRVDTVGIWYSLTGDTLPNFADKNFTRWLSAKEVLQAGSRYRFTIVNPQFNSEQKTVYAAVICIGKNDRKSPVKKSSFIVGKPRPINPIHLAAKTISSTRVMLLWNNIVSAGVERMIIWYRPFQPVPLVYDVSALGLDSLVPSITDTTIVVNGLLEQARFYFGAQVYKGGLWSFITDSASASDSTPGACCGLDSNGVPIIIPYKPKITMERRPLLQWHHVDSASTYTLVIDDNADFSSPIVLLPLSDTAFKVTADLPFGTIYWKVKSDRSAIWSKVDYFTVQPDSIPFLIRYNGSAVAANRPHFTWYSVKNAVDYKIEIADNTGFTNATSLHVSDTAFTPLADLKNSMWYWRVSCSRNYVLFAPVDSVKVEASGIIRRAAPVAPFISLTKSDRGYLISFGGYNRGEVSAVIYSVKGQFVVELKASDFGRNAMLWNYRDKYGRPVTSGVYMLKIVAPGKVIGTKILVHR